VQRQCAAGQKCAAPAASGMGKTPSVEGGVGGVLERRSCEALVAVDGAVADELYLARSS
jgi:hypothetical protein